MDLATYVVRQMEGVRSALGGLLDGVTQEEWLAVPAPGMNPVGFTAWHVPSIQDWALNTWMRNRPTIRSRPEWAAKGMSETFLPIGMDLEAAHAIARATTASGVLAYTDAVLEEARAYLATFTPEDFDRLPPNQAHLADERYQHPGYLAEVDDMYEQPFWRVFAGACTGHCRGHIGELELALAVVRG
jgi:hypothetical protein